MSSPDSARDSIDLVAASVDASHGIVQHAIFGKDLVNRRAPPLEGRFHRRREPLHVQQRKQIEAFRVAWKKTGHSRTPRVSVSRSIFPLVDDRDFAYFGQEKRDRDQFGFIDANTRAVFGRSYVGEPDVLVKELAADEAIAAADTLLMTVPNTLGVDYNAHVIETVLKYVAPELGWR